MPDQGYQKRAVDDRASERPLFGFFHVTMYPLPVFNGFTKGVHTVLGDLEPVRNTHLLADIAAQFRHRHVCNPHLLPPYG